MAQPNPKDVVRDVAIIEHRLQGKTYREIAKALNVSPMTISRALSREEMRDIIETGTQQAVALVPKAIDNFIDDMMQVPGSDNTLRTIRQKASDRVLQITGIAPSAVTNQTIINTFNQQNNLVLDPSVAQALFGAAASGASGGPGCEDDIIDIEVTDE